MAASESDDQIRVGNPERERAIGLLNDALSDGYLEIQEFDERSTVVYTARTRVELKDALAQLPKSELLFPGLGTPAEAGARSEAAPMQLNIGWTTVTRKGSWHVPARILISGTMGTVDIDFCGAEFRHAEVDIELQVSASSVKMLLAHDQSIITDDLACTGWSTIKYKAGPPAIATGPMIRLHGSLSGMSGVVIRRG